MILFSIKLETVYVMYEKVIGLLVCVYMSVSLIFAYRRPVQVSPVVFSVSCINE